MGTKHTGNSDLSHIFSATCDVFFFFLFFFALVPDQLAFFNGNLRDRIRTRRESEKGTSSDCAEWRVEDALPARTDTLPKAVHGRWMRRC